MTVVQECNRLIAEFMEYDDINCPACKYHSVCDLMQCSLTKEEKLELFQYHESWDWLMPVLKKISDHGCIVEISYCLVTSCRICVIGGKDEKAFNIMYNNNDGSQSIAPVWEAVVEYLTYLKSKVD